MVAHWRDQAAGELLAHGEAVGVDHRIEPVRRDCPVVVAVQHDPGIARLVTEVEDGTLARVRLDTREVLAAARGGRSAACASDYRSSSVSAASVSVGL
jgi:hypothetical protein